VYLAAIDSQQQSCDIRNRRQPRGYSHVRAGVTGAPKFPLMTRLANILSGLWVEMLIDYMT
jgi:hypothetical protein